MLEVVVVLAVVAAILLFTPAKTKRNRGKKSKTASTRSPKFGPERFAPEMGKLNAEDAIWVYQRYIKLHVRSADKETTKDLVQEFKADMAEHESTLKEILEKADSDIAHHIAEMEYACEDSDDASERREAIAMKKRITKLKTKTDLVRSNLTAFQSDRRQFTMSYAAFAFGRAKSPVANYHDLD